MFSCTLLASSSCPSYGQSVAFDCDGKIFGKEHLHALIVTINIHCVCNNNPRVFVQLHDYKSLTRVYKPLAPDFDSVSISEGEDHKDDARPGIKLQRGSSCTNQCGDLESKRIALKSTPPPSCRVPSSSCRIPARLFEKAVKAARKSASLIVSCD